MSKPLISIILPVYNVEKYLKECLDSIINQTLKNIEIICVDDGSTDKSLSILNEYKKKDNRIKIITQHNQYAGVARNNGLKIASGEYLIFLDSDDFFEPDMLKEMYIKAKDDDSDVVMCSHSQYDNKLKKNNYNIKICNEFVNKSPFSPLDVKNYLFSIVVPTPWNKLFKHDLFKDNNLQFLNTQCCNDVTCVNTALALSKKISIINKPFIHYRCNQTDNLTANRNKNIDCTLIAIKELENNLKKYNLYEIYKNAFINGAKNSLKWENSLCSQEQREKRKNFAKTILSENLYNILYESNNKISVILPVYNAEKYLNKCMNTIINQTYTNLEIICVNDGSTDNSLSILNEYKKKDNRIKIIDIENHGVSYARNIGYENSTGEFIVFVDSDDYIESTYCEDLLNCLLKKSSDMSYCGYKREKINGELALTWVPKKEYTEDVFYNVRENITKYLVVTKKLFKRSIIDEFNIRFDINLHYGEDSLFLYQYMSNCKCISGIKKILYTNIINPESLSRNPLYEERRKIEKDVAFKKMDKIVDDYYKKYKKKRIKVAF